jgi:hypothetical protein
VPYKDPERRRAYDRERKRAERAGVFPLSPTRVPEEFRVKFVKDVTVLLQEAVRLIQNDEQARGIERGRALLSACAVALRMIEARDVAGRLEAVERAVGGRVGDGQGYF